LDGLVGLRGQQGVGGRDEGSWGVVRSVRPAAEVACGYFGQKSQAGVAEDEESAEDGDESAAIVGEEHAGEAHEGQQDGTGQGGQGSNGIGRGLGGLGPSDSVGVEEVVSELGQGKGLAVVDSARRCRVVEGAGYGMLWCRGRADGASGLCGGRGGAEYAGRREQYGEHTASHNQIRIR